MKFSVTKSTLLEALAITGKCIASKNIVPMLDNYLFNIDNDRLKITASNSEVYLITNIDIVGGGFKRSIALSSSLLLDIVKEIPEQPIDFLIEERTQGNELLYNVTMLAGRGKYQIPAENGEFYPELKQESGISFELGADEFLSGISKTLFACGTDELKAQFTGVNVYFEDKKVTYTATNTHILSTYSFDADVESNKSFIIPARALSILTSTPHDDVIKIDLDKRSATFRVSDDTILKSVLINDSFPDCKPVIPVDNPNELIVNRLELIAALKRVVKFSNKITHVVRFIINVDALQLTANDVDFGQDAKEEVSHHYAGNPLEIGLSGKQMIDCLNKLDSQDVHLLFSSPNRAIVIKEPQHVSDQTSNLMINMPIFLTATNG